MGEKAVSGPCVLGKIFAFFANYSSYTKPSFHGYAPVVDAITRVVNFIFVLWPEGVRCRNQLVTITITTIIMKTNSRRYLLS